MSGLVSRTVLNDRAASGRATFHGAKFYAELRRRDVSTHFLDAVDRRFPAVADRSPPLAGRRRQRPHAGLGGWRAVEASASEYGIGDVNLVKPGVGETTRVLLRRVPWRVLVRPGAGRRPGHVLLLAEQRGVPVRGGGRPAVLLRRPDPPAVHPGRHRSGRTGRLAEVAR